MFTRTDDEERNITGAYNFHFLAFKKILHNMHVVYPQKCIIAKTLIKLKEVIKDNYLKKLSGANVYLQYWNVPNCRVGEYQHWLLQFHVKNDT
jgi:hypothetical protein